MKRRFREDSYDFDVEPEGNPPGDIWQAVGYQGLGALWRYQSGRSGSTVAPSPRIDTPVRGMHNKKRSGPGQNFGGLYCSEREAWSEGRDREGSQ